MQFVFLMTHLGSGSGYLCESLGQVPTICCNHTNKIYTHPTDLDSLKIKDRYAKIFIDTIEFNYSFASTALYNCCKFIYLIRNPKHSLGKMVKDGYSRESSINYYLFRLRRMYEMAHHTPKSLFLRYEDMNKDKQLIVDFLGVKDIPPIKLGKEDAETWIPDRGYEKYLSMFEKMSLNKI